MAKTLTMKDRVEKLKNGPQYCGILAYCEQVREEFFIIPRKTDQEHWREREPDNQAELFLSELGQYRRGFRCLARTNNPITERS